MKITRRRLRRLISEVRHSADVQSILEAHATISYFYGYTRSLLLHANRGAMSEEDKFPIGLIQSNLSGLEEESRMLMTFAITKAAKITGTNRGKLFKESRSILQEAMDNASLKISESFGDAYAHLLTLGYDGNNVLGTMALVDAAHIISPGIQLEERFDIIEYALQDDSYLNAMDNLT